MRAPLLSLFTAMLLLAGLAHAAPETGKVSVKSTAEVETEVMVKGKKEKKREPVAKAVPGTEIIYTNIFSNEGAKPAGNIVLTNPIPASTAYVGGSAFGANMDIAFSADGGKTYDAPEKIKIKTREGRERPALPSEYTHIRWTYKGELAAGKQGNAGFRAVIQ